MALTRQEKKEIIANLREKISRQKTMVFIDFKGLKTKNLFELRRSLREGGCDFQIVKKTLLQIALEKEGIKLDIEKLEGQVAVIFGFGDTIFPAKTVYNFFAKPEPPEILGGFLDNQFKEGEEMIVLAKVPGREELLARLMATLISPMSGLLNVLQGSTRDLLFVLNAIKK